MKQLTDKDITEMIGEDFVADENSIKKSVRQSLRLSTRIPESPQPTPQHVTIDFHQHTEEEAWSMLVDVATSGAQSATVITGASGILKQKFPQWMKESIISPHIISFEPINNGSFLVKFHHKRK